MALLNGYIHVIITFKITNKKDIEMEDHTWITNEIDGSPRQGQRYYVEEGANSEGLSGRWHIYENGHKVFMPAEIMTDASSSASDSLGFPTASSYMTPVAPDPAPMTTPTPATDNLGGWAASTDGTQTPGQVSPLVVNVEQPQTDPLKIDENQKH
jgi:hypothetical protein